MKNPRHIMTARSTSLTVKKEHYNTAGRSGDHHALEAVIVERAWKPQERKQRLEQDRKRRFGVSWVPVAKIAHSTEKRRKGKRFLAAQEHLDAKRGLST
jgi:hypothetical protein